ncbi:hypothetical protein FEM03_08460 [Phragmitibacter flavus]|uniref:Uncharacterized protein n=1 Tax=Phragmitibacter flavus TaxID=2576071 RepID=A0A5R8KFA8_9BACT|nr:hypothetical protein [Phragmitibacter flavus]TLD70941.1 hypothetical protein FEM03_08460 [Phragmitibacter flavus]
MPSPVEDRLDQIRSGGCVFVGVIAVAFALLTIFLFTWGWAWALGANERTEMISTMVCGWIYLLGSMVFFRIRVSACWLLFWGVLLNAIGGYVWVPGLRYLDKGGVLLALPGLALMACWIALVRAVFAKSKV